MIDQYSAIAMALACARHDPEAFMERLAGYGFSVVRAPAGSGFESETMRAVRRAIDAHSPLPKFTSQMVIQWMREHRFVVRDKDVHNALGYLVRSGEIERLARGHFRIGENMPNPRPPRYIQQRATD